MTQVTTAQHENIGARLAATAATMPDAIAVAMPRGRNARGKRIYDSVTFGELERDTNRIASGLIAHGLRPGMRLVLMVRPSIDFIALTFALFKAGAVIVLIDPGMGRKNILRCLEEIQPEGFVAIPLAQAVRAMMRHKFPRAKFNVTVGRRWFWGGWTLEQIRAAGSETFEPQRGSPDDDAAIIFTTGSTGPPKGVLYSHRNFNHQVENIREEYGISPGEIDLPGFPLFGLFNAAMGVTTIIPDMDPTRPAKVNPRNVIEAVSDWNVTQAFGSPAIWNVVGKYCVQHEIKLPTLRRVLSAGAPVPPSVLAAMKSTIADEGEMHTPYGATEALPVATISASEVLGETAARTILGAGTCVGKRFREIEWRVIRPSDGALATIDETEELPRGEIGELIVRGPVVTRAYVTRIEANALHKIADGETIWHRMGDVGYLDELDRFWFCGRKTHRVLSASGPMHTIPCEAVFNQHEEVRRSALVGIGEPGSQQPVIIVELRDEAARLSPVDLRDIRDDLLELAANNELTRDIKELLFHPAFPVDIRHNAKIFREKLAIWAAEVLKKNNRPGGEHDG